jgi:hypothetical protein
MIFDSYTRSVPFQCIFIVSFRLSLYLNFWISLCINATNHELERSQYSIQYTVPKSDFDTITAPVFPI